MSKLDEQGLTWRHQANGIMACCPAHDDRVPSLSISEGDKVPVVIKCHTGCATSDVLAALKLTFDDLSGAGNTMTTSAPPAEPAEYTYRDEHGQLIAVIKRDVDENGRKRFRPWIQDADGTWVCQSSEALKRTPYRLPEVLDAVAAGRLVAIVEGERDVDTAWSIGIAATCNAGGAGKWTAEHAACLKGATEILVIRDNDDVGKQHAAHVAVSVQDIAAMVRVVDVAAGNDFADHVHAGFGLADLVPVGDDLIARYPPLDWHDVWNSTSDEPEWRVPDVIEIGRSHALFSPAKAGKTLLVMELAAGLAAGKPLLGRPNPNSGPVPVLYVDMENARADLRQRLDAMGYVPADLDRLVYLSFPDLPPLDTARGGEHLLALAEHYRPGLIVLDTVSRVVTGEENSADTFRALYRHTLARLKAVGHTILRLDHEGKNPDAGQRGSSAKVDDVDTVWRLSLPSTPESDGERAVDLRCERQRSGHHPELIQLQRKVGPLRHLRVDSSDDRPAVARIITELDRLTVADSAGRTVCRTALSLAGVKVGNTILSDAIKARQNRTKRAENLSGTGPSPDDLAKIDNEQPGDADSTDVSPANTCPGQVADRSDRSTADLKGRPVRPAVTPGGGQEDGGPVQPPTTTRRLCSCNGRCKVPNHALYEE